MKTKNINIDIGAIGVAQLRDVALRTLPRPGLALKAVLVAALLCVLPAAGFALPVLGLGFAGMILDERAEFCDATALNTGAAGTYLVGDVMDLTLARDIGNGEPLYLVIQVDTAVTSGGAATVQFTLASDAQAAIATDASATVHWASAAIAKATLVAGYTLVVAIPMESPVYEQFLGILQTTGTAALTAGKINAFLTHDASKWKSYPDAI